LLGCAMPNTLGVYNIPEYELDTEDEHFVKTQYQTKNANLKKKLREFFSEDVLEIALDYFEKESFVNVCYFSLLY
jgi:hypothetical protein